MLFFIIYLISLIGLFTIGHRDDDYQLLVVISVVPIANTVFFVCALPLLLSIYLHNRNEGG